MALLNQKGFERKLQQMSSAQDSVQTVSLWIIHHKKYADDIVRVWTDHLKKCNPDRRLVMLYLANDVLQNSRKKGKEFSTAFSRVLKEVIPLLRERKINDSVQRVMKIWQERKVFEKDFLESLQRKFETSKSTKISKRRESNGEETPVESERHTSQQPSHQQKTEKRLPPVDFKPQQLIDSLKAMRDFQAQVTLKESQLNSLRIDASDVEAIKQLKDRATGAKFTSEYEAASEKLEAFCETLNLEKEEISKLIQILDDGKSFYDAAFGEVKVIVHAYKTFGNRLNSLKKKVDNKVEKIINAEAEKKKMGPITTPQASFLTSGLPDISSGTPSSTPPHKTEEAEEEKTEKITDTTVDNTEVADMDLEDDGDSENGETSESPSETASTPSSESKTSETSQTDVSLKPQVTLTTVSSSMPSASQTSSVNTSVTFTGATSAMPVQVHVPQQMVMQQPNMQFIPGQPGMPMIPVGMHGTGQFIAMQSQYHQPMVPFGMAMHGMNTFPGSVQTHMTGLLPGQASFPGQNIGLVSNLPQQMQSSVTVPQIAVIKDVPNQPRPGLSISQATVTPQGSQITTNVSSVPSEVDSKPLPSNIPSSDTPERSESRRESVDSPSSEMSAPSPIGSPELELGGDETPETASPQGIADVKIIGFPSMSGQSENATEKGNLPSEGTSTTSTGSATPNQSSDLSKPVSAVNILAQLISRGRKLKEQTPEIDVPSEASTPKEEVVEVSKPQQEKPLFSLIDSLFPKLTDSLKTIREREKDNETSTSTSEEGSPKQKIEINSMEDDEPESETGMLPKGASLEATDKNIEHRGPFTGPYHTPAGPPQEGPRGPYGIRPPEGPVRQPWNNVPFQGHPGGPRPPFREYQERPHVPPSSPLKGPSHSPRFHGPQRPFEGPKSAPPFGPSTQVEFIDSEGIQEEFRAGPERSPRQLHSPRAGFPSRPSPGGAGGFPIERGPLPGIHPDEPPINGPPRSPRGTFIGRPRGIPREEQRPRFHFDGPPGSRPRPPGPPEVYGRPPGGDPRHSPIDGPPKPRWLGPDAPRGPLPLPQDGRPRGFQRSHSDLGPGEIVEPPMKRPMLEEGHPQPYPEPGRPGRFSLDERVPIDRNREIWRERDSWDPHRDPHLGPRAEPHLGSRPEPHLGPRPEPHLGPRPDVHLGPRPDRGRPPNEFPEREEHLPPRFLDHENPFPHERLGFQPPRRNSFKGFEETEFPRREHYINHRPRLPFPGSHPRPYF